MKSKWLRAVTALGLGLTALALASPVLARDPYCAGSSDHQVGYDNGDPSYGYDNENYERLDGDEYTQYGHAQQPYSHYGYGQQGYYGQAQQRGYPHYGYRRPHASGYGDSYRNGYRNGYRGNERGYYEDHVRTTFNPFPLPHIEKRIIHHYHQD